MKRFSLAGRPRYHELPQPQPFVLNRAGAVPGEQILSGLEMDLRSGLLLPEGYKDIAGYNNIGLGEAGACYDFDGIGDYMRFFSPPHLCGTACVVAGGWFNTVANATNQVILGKDTTAGALRAWVIYVNPTRLAVAYSNTGSSATVLQVPTAGRFLDNIWHQVVFVYDPGVGAYIYVDGKLVTQNLGVPTHLFQTTAHVIIGANENGGSNHFQGLLADQFICFPSSIPADIADDILWAFHHRSLPSLRPGSQLEADTGQTVEHVLNGTFDTDVAHWRGSNASISSVSGELQVNSTGDYGNARFILTNLIPGETYQYSVRMWRGTGANNARFGIGTGTAGTATTDLVLETNATTTPTVYTGSFVATTPGAYLTTGNHSPGGLGTYLADDISVIGPRASSLNGRWRLDHTLSDANFTFIADQSGKGSHGANVSAGATPVTGQPDIPQLVSTDFKIVQRFDAVNNQYNFGNATALRFERTDSFSLSTLCCLLNTTQTVFGKQSSSSPFPGYRMRALAGGKIEFDLNSVPGTSQCKVTTTNACWSENQPFFVTCTYDGSSTAAGMHVYVDGVDQPLTVDVDNLTTSIDTNAAYIIGVSSGGQANGLIDESSVFSVELTESEALELYNNGAPIDPALGHSQKANCEHYVRNRDYVSTTGEIRDRSKNAIHGGVINFGAADDLILTARTDDPTRDPLGGRIPQQKGMNFTGEVTDGFATQLGANDIDGSFDDAGYWDIVDVSVTIANGIASINYSGVFKTLLRKNGIIDVGDYYEIQYDIVQLTSGTIRAYIGSNALPNISSLGRHRQVGICTDEEYVAFGTNGFVGAIDNVQIRKLGPTDIYDGLYGLTLGSNVVTNGDFSSGTTGWTAGGSATLDATGGVLTVTNGAAAFGYAYQALDVTGIDFVRLEGDYIKGTAGSGIFGLGTTAGARDILSLGVAATGFFGAVRDVSAYDTVYVNLWNNSNVIGETSQYDNVTVREVPVASMQGRGGTIAGWAVARSAGGGTGVLLEKRQTTAGGYTFFLSDVSAGACDLVFLRYHTPTNGQWLTTIRDIVFGMPFFWALTYDDSDPGNTPTLFLGMNGSFVKRVVGSGLTTQSVVAGVPISDANRIMTLGARDPGSFIWDGEIFEVKAIRRQITELEARALWEAGRPEYEGYA